MVNDTLQNQFQDTDFQSTGFRVYTTLDMRLQRAAAEAIRNGMEPVDQQIKKQRRFKGQNAARGRRWRWWPSIRTPGEVKALAGGRNYGMSQLNHVLAKRQPGSIFKPFVYAAAMDTAVEGGPRILTPSTIVMDQPTTFWFDGKPYEPSNFEHKFYGDVTLRTALAKSLNVATVKVAEMVGYDAVVEMANRAGMNYKIQPTPAVALGAYEITPLEAAGAYTVFANGGDYVKPSFLRLVRSQRRQGRLQEQARAEAGARSARRLPDDEPDGGGPAHRHGGGRPRAVQPELPGGGQDRHVARRLVRRASPPSCSAWSGSASTTISELDLEGAHSAAPIWAEFMKQAAQIREYRDTKAFAAPDGIVSIEIDPQSGMPATPNCPTRRSEVYISGTQPVGACPLHGGGGRPVTNVAGWEVAPPPPAGSRRMRRRGSPDRTATGRCSPRPSQRRAARQDAPPAASDRAGRQSSAGAEKDREEEHFPASNGCV